MKSRYKEFLIRDWHEDDRASVIAVISSVLAEYGLQWEPEGADRVHPSFAMSRNA
ncbi:MAG: hypothetical protein EBE86_015410 [Hormoscilla sp. GUM202]|nr:hypothetical protein [Hormoscilla sp. GUM202]